MLCIGFEVIVDYVVYYKWCCCFFVEYVMEFGGLVIDLVEIYVDKVDEYDFCNGLYICYCCFIGCIDDSRFWNWGVDYVFFVKFCV